MFFLLSYLFVSVVLVFTALHAVLRLIFFNSFNIVCSFCCYCCCCSSQFLFISTLLVCCVTTLHLRRTSNTFFSLLLRLFLVLSFFILLPIDRSFSIQFHKMKWNIVYAELTCFSFYVELCLSDTISYYNGEQCPIEQMKLTAHTHTHKTPILGIFDSLHTHTHTAWAFCCCFLFKRQSSIVTMCSIAHSFHSLSVWIFLRISRYCIVSISRLYSYTNVISHHNQTRSHLLHVFFFAFRFVCDK